MQTNACAKCSEPAEFGYKVKGEMQWFCEQHRLSQNYADARLPKPSPPTPERKLAEHAEAIKVAGTRVVSDVIEIGRHLTEAKKLCGHGNWQPWLEREFGWTDRTALRFMHVYANRTSVSDLELPLSGLYLLAAPSTPPEARQEVADRIESGERLTVAEVKETITKAKADSPSLVPDKPKAGHEPSAPDDIIDKVVVLFKGLTLNDQNRCLRRLAGILRGAS